MTVARLTQGTVETLSQADPKARITQAAIEVASQGTPAARLSHEPVEVLSQVNPAARFTHATVEVLNQIAPTARIAQAAVEVLSSTLEAPVIGTHPIIFVCTAQSADPSALGRHPAPRLMVSSLIRTSCSAPRSEFQSPEIQHSK